MKERRKRPFPWTMHEAAMLLLLAVRRENPRSRAVALFTLARNGRSVKQSRCVHCGQLGPTWCAKWRKTTKADTWEAQHGARHAYDVSRTLARFCARKACTKLAPSREIVPSNEYSEACAS